MFNMVMGSLSPAVVGAISDALKPRPDGLMLAMTATSTTALLLAAGLMLLCGRGYVQTTRAARAVEAGTVSTAGLGARAARVLQLRLSALQLP